MPIDAARRALVNNSSRLRDWSSGGERAMDLTIAIIALVCAGPLLLLIALAVLAERRGSIFFLHQRVGLNDSRFHVIKFRTMCTDGDRVLAEHLDRSTDSRNEWAANHKLRDDPRVTKLGRFLRKASLDELPQLWNVIRGEMSIVGPRPIVEDEIIKYGQFFDAYCVVKPGITGIWQISGRNDVSYQRRVEMDALYARKKSVLLDLKIIFSTIPAVVLRRGSY